MENKQIILDIDISTNNNFNVLIENAIKDSEEELLNLLSDIDISKKIKGDCDKIDYALAASSGALCGIIDIFLIGQPGDSFLLNVTDKWIEDRVIDFAKLCKWNPKKKPTTSNAISYLEKCFKVPYDQTNLGKTTKKDFVLNTKNHHFKSLAHNPTLMGLFFSIINQFNNTSDFVSDGQLFTINNSNPFEIDAKSFVWKIVVGFCNWLGHLVSDISGSSTSKLRGMGIPSPIMSIANDFIVIREKFNLPKGELLDNINEFALKIYQEGYDFRFQTAQLIPVAINEILVRLLYLIKRMIVFYSNNKDGKSSIREMWNECNPFKKDEVKRMLTVAHGTFCLMDTADAIVRSFITGNGTFNFKQFFVRFNLMGFGRFTISLYGEGKRAIEIQHISRFAYRKKRILEYYIQGLKELSNKDECKYLISFVDDFNKSKAYQLFVKSIKLGKSRNVPDDMLFHSLNDIDEYFCKKE